MFLAVGTSTSPFTIDLLMVLAAAALLAIVGQRLRLAIVPAYLITGVLIGPHAMGLVQSPQSLDAIGQLAIILLLFGIGLELHLTVLKHDWVRMVLAGVVSCVLCVLVGWPVALAFGLSAPAGLVVCMALSLSSTAVVLRTLSQNRELRHTRGRLAFSILIVQDLLVLAMLVALPALRAWAMRSSAEAATQPVGTQDGAFWMETALDLTIFIAILVLGKILLPRLLAESARERSTESMMIFSVAVAIGAAVITEWLGFSAALGAFLAGFMLASTPFRYQLRGQVAPLRNLFIAVFFTALGMQFDPALALSWWWVILLGVVVVTVVKTATIGGTCWSLGATGSVSAAVGLALAQGGEFSLVLIESARGMGLVSQTVAANVIAVVIVTLILTPAMIGSGFKIVCAGKWSDTAPWIKSSGMHDPDATEGADQPRRRRVIIGGFGPIGRAVADRLATAEVEVVIVELNPATVRRQAHLGKQVVYGDVSDPEVLQAAGIHEAAALVLTIPDQDAAVRACAVARSLEPNLFIAARTTMLSQGMLASQAGADHVTVEELSTAEYMLQAVVQWLSEQTARATITTPDPDALKANTSEFKPAIVEAEDKPGPTTPTSQDSRPSD